MPVLDTGIACARTALTPSKTAAALQASIEIIALTKNKVRNYRPSVGWPTDTRECDITILSLRVITAQSVCLRQRPQGGRVGSKITVYSYWTWIPGEGLGHIAPAKRTLSAIEAMGGLAILVSGEEVDVDDLTRDGAYSQSGQALAQA
jgi:hypothetical protein